MVFSTLWLTAALGIDLTQQAIAVQPLLHHAAQTAAELDSVTLLQKSRRRHDVSNTTTVTGTAKFNVATSDISDTVHTEITSIPDQHTIALTFAITNTAPLSGGAPITSTVMETVKFDFGTSSDLETVLVRSKVIRISKRLR